MKAVLARAEKLQPVLNCFITLIPEQAMAAARQAEDDVMQGKPLGLLHGIPYAAKDLVNTAGVRTTFGSLLHENNVPKEDAVAIARLKQAGAILFGKTTTPEFGHKALTDAPLFGRTRNAWSAERTSGGSSGGAAVAVAAGIGPIGIATDGGGSTRIPGGGQRHGRAEAEQRRDPAQPGRRRVRQLHLRDADDAHGDGYRADAAGHGRAASVGSLVDRHRAAGLYRCRAAPTATSRASVSCTALTLGNTLVSKDVRAAFERALGKLRDLGAELVELDGELPDMEPIWKVINHTTWRARFDEMIRRDGQSHVFLAGAAGRDGRADGAAPTTSAPCSSAPTSSAWCRSWFEDADYVVTPTLSRTALPIDQDLFEPIAIDGIEAGELRRNWFPYTMPFNITGHPAITCAAASPATACRSACSSSAASATRRRSCAPPRSTRRVEDWLSDGRSFDGL